VPDGPAATLRGTNFGESNEIASGVAPVAERSFADVGEVGLGLAVRTDPGNAKPPPPGDLGELKWDGASGCYFVIHRKQDMFFVLLEQTPSERQRVQRTLKQLIYEAMEN
jgi:hypothetical protein